MDSDLKIMLFSDNQLTFLGIDEFQNYQRLQEIYLVRNRIEVIAPDAFRGLHSLQILDLEGNKLHVIPKDTFQHLSSVRILSFKSNPIRYISDHTFDMLVNIEELNFENCWLERVEPNVFQGLNRLNEVNLVNNELKAISSSMENSLPQSLKVFRLHRNPWQCDCRLRWLRDWISKSQINWDFSHNTPTCNGPPLIRSIDWRQLTADQFACPARIESSNSTSLELPTGGNITIVCKVFGDPDPDITWKKGDKNARDLGSVHNVIVSNAAEKEYKSTLTLRNVQLSHAGDYKCIAENFAGRSEVTYKLWVEGVGPAVDTGETNEEESGMSKEAYLGIGVAVAVLLLLIVICAIYGLKKREVKRHEYKVRDYKKPNKGACNKDGPAFDEEDQTHIKDKAKENVATNGTETEKKELLDKKENNGPQANKRDGQIITTAQTELPAENKHLLTKEEPIKDTVTIEKEKVKDEDTESFQMKIFSTYSEQQKEEMKRQKEMAKQQQQQEPNNLGAASPPPEQTFAKANGKVASKDSGTPDILRNGKHGIPNHKPGAVPVPPPTVPNHLESAHQRAPENPYAKPSELRPATRKSGSADDLLDCKHHNEDFPKHHTKDRSKEKEVTFKDPPTTTRVKIRDPSPKSRDHHKHCNNPVCLKDHTLMPDAPQLRGSQSLTGMNTVGTPGGLQEIDVDHIVDPVYHRSGLSDRYVDRYRTLPSKSSRHPGSASKHYSPPTTAISSPARGGTGSSSPYQTLPGRGSPTKQHRGGSPSRAMFDRYGGFPPPPPSAYGIVTPRGAMSSPEDNIMYGPFSSSPPKAARRTFQGSATLDELLSPPFGNIAGSPRGVKSPGQKKLPKPGEKDEFGTAV